MGVTGRFQLAVGLILVLLGGLRVTAATASDDAPAPIHLLAYQEAPYMMNQIQGRRGVAIDIAMTLFERQGIPYKLRFMPPRRAYATATTEPNSCVLAIERSQEREAGLRWIGPFLIARHAFYRMERASVNLGSLEQARPYRVGAMLGSGASEYLASMGFAVDHVPDNGLNLGKLELGRIDLWASDVLSATVLLNGSDLNVVKERVFLTTLREMACHPDTPKEVLVSLQEGLDRLYQEGVIRTLYERYLGHNAVWLE